MNQQHQRLYPDISGLGENHQSPSILHFLQALGLVPPETDGGARLNGENPTAPPGPGEPVSSGSSTQQNQVPPNRSDYQEHGSGNIRLENKFC